MIWQRPAPDKPAPDNLTWPAGPLPHNGTFRLPNGDDDDDGGGGGGGFVCTPLENILSLIYVMHLPNFLREKYVFTKNVVD